MQQLIPFRWPAAWTDASKLDLLRGTPINCLVGDEPPPFALGGLPFFAPDALPETILLREGVWPQVLAATEEDVAEAGATGAAWLDSNVRAIRLAQTLDPEKTVWLHHQAPDGEVVPLDSFVRPIAEARIHGAHWIITLSPPFVEALDNATDEALGAWRRMMAALRLFDEHAEWRAWRHAAPLAVVSTFEGMSALFAAEFLNLAPRRHLAYRTLSASDVAAASLDGIEAILYLEMEPPEGAIREKLLAFADAGGLVIAPQGLVSDGDYEVVFGYRVYRRGKGRVAMPPESWYDPYRLVTEAHVLVGRRADPVRVWNGSDMLSHFLIRPDGRRGVVHLTGYTAQRSMPVTIGLSRPYRAARVLTAGGERSVEPIARPLGVEIPVGEFSHYAAVEVDA